MDKALYICDGNNFECPRTACYAKGGPCFHTANEEYSLKKKLGVMFPPTIFVHGVECLGNKGGIFFDDSSVTSIIPQPKPYAE